MTANLNSSRTHVPLISISPSERCWHCPLMFCSSTHVLHKQKSTFLFQRYGNTGWNKSMGGTTVHLISPSIWRQASMLLHVPYMYDRMCFGEFGILANIRVQWHYIKILNCFCVLLYLVVKTHASFRPPYRVSRVCRGLWVTIGCVSNCGFISTIWDSSNWHSHITLTV